MFIGIDGTRFNNNAKYILEMKDSFINQLILSTTQNNIYYLYGPTATGLEDSDILDTAVDAVRKFISMGDTVINLAGYSRGGVIAIRTARKIFESEWGKDLKVTTLLLFDAVARDVIPGGDCIPANVEFSYHAVRNPDVESRTYFGNCGKSIEGPGKLILKYFRATHSGMGGMPWGGDHPVYFTPYSYSPMGDSTQVLGWGTGRWRKPTTSTIPTATPIITESEDKSGSVAVRTWMWAAATEKGVIQKV